MILRIAMMLLFTVSCGKKEAQAIGGAALEGVFRYIQSQLVEEFLSSSSGTVTSLDLSNDEGEADIGDSLLFTGIALGSVSCEIADRLVLALERMQDVNEGYLVRFNPLPAEYKKNPVSRDGAIGALFGLVRAEKRCPELSKRIKGVKEKWKAAIGSSLFLHPNSSALITPQLQFWIDAAYGKGMNAAKYSLFMSSALVTAQQIKEKKSACYPVHLETLQFLTMEVQGVKLTKEDKKNWCSITDGMGLMLTDWYCGRSSERAKAWLKYPETSQHIYMHQRCSWESPDVGSLRSPRVDYLVLYRLMSEGSNPF